MCQWANDPGQVKQIPRIDSEDLRTFVLKESPYIVLCLLRNAWISYSALLCFANCFKVRNSLRFKIEDRP